MDTSPEAARAALGLIWRGAGETELCELSVLSRRRWKTVHCTVAEALGGGGEDGVAALRRASAAGAAAYFGACLLKERPPAGRRGGSGLRSSAGALWLDVDCAAPGRDGPEYFRTVDEALEAVDAALDEVLGTAVRGRGRVLVVGTGWGVQYWLPLDRRVAAIDGSRMTAMLVAAVAGSEAVAGRKIDKVSDATRVMRMPGTWNWRAGIGAESPTGVLRMPAGPAFGADGLRARLQEVAGGGGGGGGGGGRARAGGGRGPLMDVETLADEVLTWEQVLVPGGWRRAEGVGIAGWGGRESAVWSRPGGGSERSAVVFSDDPDLLVVFSDSADCGFRTGLRRGRAGAGAAGAGVISKWRAWVDLQWHGDRERALESLPEELAEALAEEERYAADLTAGWGRRAFGRALGGVAARTEAARLAAAARV